MTQASVAHSVRVVAMVTERSERTLSSRVMVHNRVSMVTGVPSHVIILARNFSALYKYTLITMIIIIMNNVCNI